ncbi:MAG: ATP-binding protein [Nitrospirae bacterium]|nr:MAG: ATP-binding protein [Nitrospirota bacterium]
MDFNFSFVVKEEILRNLLKTHKNVLIVGKPGTGKTTTALKVTKESGNVSYYSANMQRPELDESIKYIDNLEGLDSATSDNHVIIADDINSAGAEAQEKLLKLISDSQSKGKKILIANFLVELKPFLSAVDVVVRFKADTAQMVFTEVVDIGKI